MGIVALEGFGGGGGASLNFKVVGNPQPVSPKENTIWVNTDAEITSWAFSAAEPETATQGMVWISTGASSPVEFNALKKNNITVYPISAKQYVNGSWVNVTAKSYQDGAWVEWIMYLYNMGDECIGLTGGWTAQGMTYKKGNDCNVTAATIDHSNNQMVITMPAGYKTGVVWTAKNIDLTNVHALLFKGYVEDVKYNGTRFIVIPDTATTYWDDNAVAKVDVPKTINTTTKIDVTSLTGSYRVGVGMCSSTGSGSPIIVHIDEIVSEVA